MALCPNIKILNTEPGRLSDSAKNALKTLASVENVEADREYLLEHINQYDVLFICMKNVIDEKILDRAAKLKYIVTPTTGTDHIDVAKAEKLGIKIISLKGETAFLENVTATAELAWGLLLSLCRNIPAANKSVTDGIWNRDLFYGRELKNKTLGIVGYGRLGKMVAEYGNAFRMNIVAHDNKTLPAPPYVKFVDMDELLRVSDVISVHLPLEESTKLFFDREKFGKMKNGAIFINTSRGGIVDEAVLLELLISGKLLGAAIDVMAEETSLAPDWLTKSKLREYAEKNRNLLITPHIGGATKESVEDTNMFIIQKLEKHLGAQ